MSKHTPGPWAPYDRVDGNVTVLGGIGGDDLVLRTEEWSDNEADMYLIAAAPELLDGVKELVEWLEMEYPESLHQKHFGEWYKLIAKAEGSTK